MYRTTALSGLRGRLLLLVLLGALPIIGITLHEGFELRRHAAADARKDALRTAEQMLAGQQRLLGETRILLTAFSQIPQVRSMDAGCNTLLATLLEEDNRYANYGVIGADGLLRCSALPFNPPVDFSQRAYFRRAMETRTFATGDYQIGLLAQQPVLVMALPLLDAQKMPQGVIYASLKLQWLNQKMAGAKLPADSVLALLDGDYNILARYPEPENWIGKNLRERFMEQGLELHDAQGTFEATGLDGVRRLFGYVRMADLPGEHDINLLVGIPVEHAYRRVDEVMAHQLLIVGLALLAMLGASWYLGGALIGRGVERLTAASRRLAEGDLAARVAPEGVREVQALGQSFNRMADDLTRQMHEVGRLNRVYRVLSSVNGALLRVRDRERLLRDACRIATREGMFPFAWVALKEGEGETLRIVAHAGHDGALLQLVQQRLARAERCPSMDVVRRNEHYLCNDLAAVTEDELAWRDGVLALGLQALVLLPLHMGSKGVGVFALHARERGFFDSAELRLLNEVAADISLGLELIDKEKSLHYVANYDRITHLPNRYLFEDRLAQILTRAQRDGRVVTVVAVDLPDLRKISDSLGRHVGDQVLRETGAHLARTLRDGDVVARIGGHSYAVALSDMAREEDVPPVVTRLMEQFPFSIKVDGQEVTVYARAGVALFPRDGTGQHELLHNAELVLHSASSAKDDVIAYYSPEISVQGSSRFQMERELHHAQEHGELWLAYQPVVDIGTRHVVGLEALLRWDNEVLGSVSPVRFIPVAEDTGLIVPIGEWVLEQACRQGMRWRLAGLPPVRIAVNVSVRQLQREGGVERLLDVMRQLGLEPQDLPLAIEVTESKLMDNLQQATALLEQVRSQGINVYVDDFGTGYSSLAYLKRLPVDVLKIDRSFIMDLANDTQAVALVDSVITLAHGLGLRVVAEGVESEEQLAILARLGCDHAQGYLFSRPVPAAEVTELLQRDHL